MDSNKPANEVEAQLIAIWKEVFSLEEIGRDDDFFDLGGHSLRAVQVASRVKEHFRVRLAVNVIFDKPTIAELADHIVDALLVAAPEPVAG
jgi:acyl carrier protein